LQKIVDFLQRRGKLYKLIKEILPKELGVRNKIKIYHAVDTKGYFTAIFVVSQKSKILLKDVERLQSVYDKLVLYSEHNFKHKMIFIDAPLCSKAKQALKDLGWSVEV